MHCQGVDVQEQDTSAREIRISLILQSEKDGAVNEGLDNERAGGKLSQQSSPDY